MDEHSITDEQAVAYVQSIEAKWECYTETVVRVVARVTDWQGRFVEVVTNNATWSVWREPTGRIYGEC